MELLKIENQEWSTSNLNVDRFKNGDLIREAKSMDEWIAAAKNKEAAFCFYDNNPVYGEEYGKMYNWYAVNDPRGIAPDGFRVPLSSDINQLIINLTGGSEVDMFLQSKIAGKNLKLDSQNWQVFGKVSNGKLKESFAYDEKIMNQFGISNSDMGKGFNARPGGVRNAIRFRDFQFIQSYVAYWTSSKDDKIDSDIQSDFYNPEYAFGFKLDFFSDLGLSKFETKTGCYVRVLRDNV
jgi:uncharacterized protein (TIGR02145 family)